MKIKLLLLSLLFFVEISFAQNYVTYSSKSGIVTTNSGVEGSFDIVISCYGSSGIPVILNQHFLCGDPDGFVSNLASNGLSLIPGQTTTLKFKFKKTVTSDTQKVYKFTTNGSCFQNESEMIKITVNYKNGSTTIPTNPTNPTNPNPEPNLNKITYNGIPSNYVYKNEGDNSIWIIGTDMGPNITYQWFKRYWAGTQPEVKIVGATGKDYLPTDFDSFNYWRRSYNASKVLSSNVIEITVIKAPKLENNILTLNGNTVSGSLPTGGTGSYSYYWELDGGDVKYSFPAGTGQSVELPSWIHNELYEGLNEYYGLYITRYVTSGNETVGSNSVRIPLMAAIKNNIITLQGNTVSGSLPIGGTGTYSYYWELDGGDVKYSFPAGTGQSVELPSWIHNELYEGLNEYYGLYINRYVTSGSKTLGSNSVRIPLLKAKKIASNSSEIYDGLSANDILTVYPNPTSESVNFSTSFSINKEIEIIVYSDKLGNEKSVYKGVVVPNQVVNWNIPPGYQKGIYFFKIFSGNKEVKTGKIIIQ